jgi:2,4-dienoyl-CoA reductase (NADPH2)
VLAVPPQPVEWLYNDLSSNTALQDAGVTVSRVGDAVAPRRAHAAVIDGERIGSSF